jgi:hypothetical protein
MPLFTYHTTGGHLTLTNMATTGLPTYKGHCFLIGVTTEFLDTGVLSQTPVFTGRNCPQQRLKLTGPLSQIPMTYPRPPSLTGVTSRWCSPSSWWLRSLSLASHRPFAKELRGFFVQVDPQSLFIGMSLTICKSK